MARASEPRLVVLHGLRLKNLVAVDVLSALVTLDEAEVDGHLRELHRNELVSYRDGRLSGWSLTATGRVEGERLVAEEVERHGLRDAIDDAYRRFLELNGEMLATCTAWQVRGEGDDQRINDHRDETYDKEVIARLGDLHDRALPVWAELAELLLRFCGYGGRFESALDRVGRGDHDWFAKPLIDSYHTVWFELHEDLLVTLGVERASEDPAGQAGSGGGG